MDDKDEKIAALCRYIDELHDMIKEMYDQIRNDDIAFAEISKAYPSLDPSCSEWKAAEQFDERMANLRCEVVW